MADILISMKAMRDNLSGVERRIVDHILSNLEAIPFCSVYEISKATNTSVASVSRLAKKFGCADFKGFKIQIARAVSSGVSALYQNIDAKDSDGKIVKKVFDGNIRSLGDTLQILDVPALAGAAKKICRCKTLACFGLGSSGYIAADTALRFSHLGIDAHAYTDSLQCLVRAARFRKGDVVMGISHSGRSVVTVKCLRLAREKGIFSIGISNYLNSALSKSCDVFLGTSFLESKVKAAALSSRVSQICLIDSLYLLVARYMANISGTEYINDLAEEYLRLNPRNQHKL